MEKEEINDVNGRDLQLKKIEPLLKLNENIKGFAIIDAIKLPIIKELKPFWINQYKIPFYQLKKVDEEIDELLKNGIIEKIKENHNFSRYNSSIIVVEKSEGKIRLVQDFRILNSKIDTPLNWIPKIQSIYNKLSGTDCCVFSKLDLKSAYNQILLDEKSRKYTAFSNPGCLNTR
jgi:hypothetical protein